MLIESWSFEEVEERLVEAAELWRRAPGGGRWPFASDAPWHLMSRATVAGDYDARGGDLEAARLKPLPLVRAEIARRDEASEWIGRFVREEDRRLVAIVIAAKAEGSVRWADVKQQLGVVRGIEGLRKRYSRAITGIAKGLSKARVPVLGIAA